MVQLAERRSPVPYEIVKPTENDISGMWKIWSDQYTRGLARAQASFYGYGQLSPYEPFSGAHGSLVKEYLRGIITKDELGILVAKQGERVDALVILGRETRSYFGTNKMDYGTIEALLIGNWAGGRSLGSKLVSAAEKHFRQQGLTYVIARVTPFSSTSFLDMQGYRTDGEIFCKQLKPVGTRSG